MAKFSNAPGGSKSGVNNSIQPQMELDRDFIPVLVICKNEGDLKNY